jgi:hypothetical protein
MTRKRKKSSEQLERRKKRRNEKSKLSIKAKDSVSGEKKRKRNVTEKVKRLQNFYRRRTFIRKLKRFSSENSVGTPHPMVTISEAQYATMRDNCVILTCMKRECINSKNCCDGGLTRFTLKSWGKNLDHIFSEVNSATTASLSFDLDAIYGGYFIVLCSAEESCLKKDQNISYISVGGKDCDYVILCCAMKMVKEKINTINSYVWDNKTDLKVVKRFKKSTIKNSEGHHYGSSGQCYSFGIRNSYSRSSSGNVTVTNYAGDMACEMKKYEQYIWKCFSVVFKSFDSLIKGFSDKLNVCCRSMLATSKENELGDIIKKMEEENSEHNNFILTGNINVNAKTKLFHCEKDTTYTTIYVPKQVETSCYIIFEFSINEKLSFQVKFNQESCFSYSAYCFAHRQLDSNGKNCMNVSTYSGKRLYCSYRKSLLRLEEVSK